MNYSSCPKCGACALNWASGPHYDKNTNRLQYSCRTCGFQWSERTQDDPAREEEGTLHRLIKETIERVHERKE